MADYDVKKVYADTLSGLMEEDSSVCAVDMDLARISGADKLLPKFQDRVFNAGIAEQNAVDVAAGLASMGMVPFVSGFCGFLATRASDQCLDTLCYNELNVKLFGTYAGISSAINGGTHISITDLASFRSMPGMTVIEVSDGREMAWAIRAATATPGPVYIRVPKGPLPEIFSQDTEFAIGKGIVLMDNRNRDNGTSDKGPANSDSVSITLITSGVTTPQGMAACNSLVEKGLKMNHIHMNSIKPLDEDLIIDFAHYSDVIVTCDNHSVIGGLGDAVASVLSTKAPTRLVKLGVQDEFCEGMKEGELAERHGISADRITDMILSLI